MRHFLGYLLRELTDLEHSTVFATARDQHPLAKVYLLHPGSLPTDDRLNFRTALPPAATVFCRASDLRSAFLLLCFRHLGHPMAALCNSWAPPRASLRRGDYRCLPVVVRLYPPGDPARISAVVDQDGD